MKHKTPPTTVQLSKMFKEIPDLAHLAPYVSGGIKAVEYAFSLLDATKTVAAPRGIEVAAIEIRAKNVKSKKAMGEIAVANFILDAVKKRIGYEESEA